MILRLEYNLREGIGGEYAREARKAEDPEQALAVLDKLQTISISVDTEASQPIISVNGCLTIKDQVVITGEDGYLIELWKGEKEDGEGVPESEQIRDVQEGD